MDNVKRGTGMLYKGFHVIPEQGSYFVKRSNGEIMNDVPCKSHLDAVQWIDAYRSRDRNNNNQNIATKEEKPILTFG